MPKVKLFCKICAKSFLTRPCEARRGRLFCNSKCRIKYVSDINRGNKYAFNYKHTGDWKIKMSERMQEGNATSFKKGNKPWNKKLKIEVQCQSCDIFFQRLSSQLKRTRGKFCSKRCFYIYKKTLRGKRSPLFGRKKSYKSRPGMLGKPPWNKGKKGLQIGWLKGKHLSEEHKEKLKKSHKTEEYFRKMGGKNNPSWKGGITPINNKIRGSIEYKLWQDSVFSRDGYCCKKCIKIMMPYKLVAHHILNFSRYIELRFAIDNGITFCKEDHKLFHKQYGKKNNTQEQINNFVL